MSKINLAEKVKEEWEKSLKPDKFVSSEQVINETKEFFKSYDTSTEEKKRDFIKKLAQVFSNVFNIDVNLKIPQAKMPNNTCGCYDRNSKTVTIFVKNQEDEMIPSNEILVTLLHELRHAYQNQHIVKENSDFGKMMKYYTKNYISSGENNYVDEVGYRTNFTEVDAQRFSFAVAKALATEIYEKSTSENRIQRKMFQVKLWRIQSASTAFEGNYAKNMKIVENFDSIMNHLKEHLKSSINKFYTSDFNAEQEKINADLLTDSLNNLFGSRSIKSINNMSIQDLAELFIEILSSTNPEDLVNKPNNSLTTWLKSMEKSLGASCSLIKRENGHIIVYKDYIERLQEGVEFGRIFLDKFNIPTDGTNKDIYLKYAKNSFEYLSTLFKNEKIDEFNKMLAENVISLETRDPKKFGREKMFELIEKNYSEADIKKTLRANIDNNNSNEMISIFQLNKNLFDGYGVCYSSETNNGIYSQFLNYSNISYDKNNFDDIIEKFNKNYPIFMSNCLGNSKLQEDAEDIIFNSSIYYINNEKIMQSILSELTKKYSKTELKNIFEQNPNDFIVQFLKQRGVLVEDFVNELDKQKEISQPANE